MTKHIEQLSIAQLSNVHGGAGFPTDALGESLKLGAEGSIKAFGQSDAPSVSNGINSFNQNYNPIYQGLSGAQNYLNPSPGNGAPGDTYNPASMNSSGGITGGSFSAPE